MNNGDIRKKVFLGLWQVIYNRAVGRRDRPVQMLDIQREINIKPSLILNAIRFLDRKGLIERVDKGYGWRPLKKDNEVEGCWEHGYFNLYDETGEPVCPKCKD